jgi:hypothetical protein
MLVLGLLVSLLAVDTATAGLLGLGRRRWERRKAELHAQLSYQLENKLDHDLAQQMEAATAKLTAVAEERVQVEAEKLQQQVQQAITELRVEAAKLVADEAARLDQRIAENVEQLKQQTHEVVQAEAAKLKEQADQQLSALNAKYAETSQALQGTFDQEIAKLPGQISDQIDKAMAAWEAKQAQQQAPAAPQPQDTPGGQKSDISATQSAALPSKEVELTEETSGDEGGQ